MKETGLMSPSTIVIKCAMFAGCKEQISVVTIYMKEVALALKEGKKKERKKKKGRT
jgi:hypothetical protein